MTTPHATNTQRRRGHDAGRGAEPGRAPARAATAGAVRSRSAAPPGCRSSPVAEPDGRRPARCRPGRGRRRCRRTSSATTQRDRDVAGDAGGPPRPAWAARTGARRRTREQRERGEAERDERDPDAVEVERRPVPEQPQARTDRDRPQPADVLVRGVRGRRDVGGDGRQHDHGERQQRRLQPGGEPADPARGAVDGAGERAARAVVGGEQAVPPPGQRVRRRGSPGAAHAPMVTDPARAGRPGAPWGGDPRV